MDDPFSSLKVSKAIRKQLSSRKKKAFKLLKSHGKRVRLTGENFVCARHFSRVKRSLFNPLEFFIRPL